MLARSLSCLSEQRFLLRLKDWVLVLWSRSSLKFLSLITAGSSLDTVWKSFRSVSSSSLMIILLSSTGLVISVTNLNIVRGITDITSRSWREWMCWQLSWESFKYPNKSDYFRINCSWRSTVSSKQDHWRGEVTKIFLLQVLFFHRDKNKKKKPFR